MALSEGKEMHDMSDIQRNNIIRGLLKSEIAKKLLSNFEFELLYKKYIYGENGQQTSEQMVILNGENTLLTYYLSGYSPLIHMNISALGFENRVLNALREDKVSFVYQLLAKTNKELMTIRGIGESCMTNIMEILDKFDLKFACDQTYFPLDPISWLPISSDGMKKLNSLEIITLKDLLDSSFEVQRMLNSYGVFVEIQMLVKNIGFKFEYLDPEVAILNYFPFSESIMRSFRFFGFKTMGEFLKKGVKWGHFMPGVGDKTYNEILNIIHSYGYVFADEKYLQNDSGCYSSKNCVKKLSLEK